LLDRLATDQRGTVLIAAAGNDGTSQNLFWPAASAPGHPGVISVGALRRDGRGRACFSNHGDWVTVFTYGEDVINLFRPGRYVYQHDSYTACRYYHPPLYPNCGCVTPTIHKGDEVNFGGRAQWSGTSFATPIVAGMVAAHMTHTGEMSDARRAAMDLLDRHATSICDEADQEALRVLR
jgi:subtilisin family serine protease